MEYTPQKIDHEMLSKIIDNYEEHFEKDNHSLWGKFYLQDDDGEYMTCDNSTGHCDIQIFSTKEEAIAYLTDPDFDIFLGPAALNAAPQSARDMLQERIDQNMDAYKAVLADRSPDELMQNAFQTVCVSEAYRILSEEPLSKDVANHLLAFQNPLKVVSETMEMNPGFDPSYLTGELMDVVMENQERNLLYHEAKSDPSPTPGKKEPSR